MDIRFYFSLFLRRLPWFLCAAVSVAALGITVARILPTVYVAAATLVVEGEQIPDSLAASTVRTNANEQLQIIQQRILSRDTLIDMANRLQIYAPQPGQPARQMDGDALVQDLRKRIAIVTTDGADRGVVQATLVNVRFDAPTADLAAAVANDVVTQILKINVEMRTGSARQTLDFFQQEVARLDKELAQHGAEMLKFKEANKRALPEGLSFNQSLQVTLLGQVQQVQAAGAELTDRRDRMVRLHEASAGGNDTGGTSADPAQAMSVEQQQLRALKDQLTAQQAVLSPKNPRIKLLQSQIAALEQVVSGQKASGLVDAAGKAMSAYDVQLADLDAKLAGLAAQNTALTDQMTALQAAIDATAGNAIALDVLQRNYDNTKAQYDLAVTNKARAETGDTIETLSKGQRISVIEQAVAPTAPARPNRKVIAAGGVVGGLLLGLALVALIEALQTGIRRPAEITAKLGFAVFATLPYMKTAREIRLGRLRIAGAVLLTLLVVAGGLWAIDSYYMPLDLLFDQIVKRVSQTALSARPLA